MMNRLTHIFRSPQKEFSRLNRYVQSVSWLAGFALGVLLCFVVLAANVFFSELHPGNIWGITYGILAAILMIAAALYGFRRRSMKLSWGRSQTWLQLHIYGGSLCLLLILMHTRFQVPTGILTWWLWALALWVGMSGLLGVLLQKWIPKLLASGLSIEVLYHRIPELVKEIGNKVKKLIEGSDASVQDFYQNNLKAGLAAPQFRWIYYLDITGGQHSNTRKFKHLRSLLSEADQEKLDELESYYRTKLELDAHYSLQKGLRWWLYLHVPVSLVMLALLALHIYSVVWY